MTDLRTVPLSVLDLASIGTGSNARQALAATIALSVEAERMGFTRFWLAEHHNMPGIASSAPAVIIGRVAAATQTLRVGSGGVMLPNHAPLVVAEQFGTLEALFPHRIDLGLGRAPGTDGATARALRRSEDALSADELMISTFVHSPAARLESLERVRALFPKDLPVGRNFEP